MMQMDELLREAYSLYHKAHIDEAIRAFQKVYSSDENNCEAIKGLALSYIRKHDESNSIEYLRKYLAIRPDDARYLRFLADSLDKVRLHSEAADYYLRCLSIDHSASTCKRLLKCLNGVPDEQRVKALQKALEANPTDPLICLQLAESYLGTGSNEVALELLKGAINANPDDHRIISLLLKLAISQEDYQKAYKLATRLVALKPDNRVYRYYYYRAAFGIGYYQQALETVRLLVGEAPGDYRYILGEGFCLYQLQAYEEAIAKMERASQLLGRKSWRILYNVGMAAIRLGDLSNAEQSLRESLELSKNATEPIHALANVLYEKGNYVEAKELFNRMLQTPARDPNTGRKDVVEDSQEIPLVSYNHKAPRRVERTIHEIARTSKLARMLKSLYGDACQICGARIIIGPEQYYSEVHHIRPLGSKHSGPDGMSNMLVLCPNHHTAFDYGCIAISLKANEVYEYQVSGVHRIATLHLEEGHRLSSDCLKYYLENIFLGHLE